MNGSNFPSSKDLVSQIKFDVDNGKIWFNEQRMLMVHSSLFSNLRAELINTIGERRAQGLLMRLGYHSGWRDAGLARKLRPNLSTSDAFFAGPQLALIKGMVNVTPISLDFDVGSGSFHAEFQWKDAYEAELHMKDHGVASEPVCWQLVGYASGFTTYYMGRPILFREVECAGCGAQYCRIVGKPAEEWDDHEAIERLLEPDAMVDELLAVRTELSRLQETIREARAADDQVVNSVGRSKPFKDACRLIIKAASTSATVLLQGETGVGKEIFARALHLKSPRASRPFIAVNCACIPPELIESELFGVEKGAYTGAESSRAGKFERANGGTLFLDEIVELTSRAQAALLRVLQEGEYERVGGTETRRLDVRLVAATHEDLEAAVRSGKFRADLFYRINVYPVKIPALRERKEDIPILIEHFLEKYHSRHNKLTAGVSDMAMRQLIDYDWPGNVRELENLIERGVILTDTNHVIELSALFPSLKSNAAGLSKVDAKGKLKTTVRTEEPDFDVTCESLLSEGFNLEQFEAKILRYAMHKCNGNVSAASRLLGISRPQLAYRLEKYK